MAYNPVNLKVATEGVSMGYEQDFFELHNAIPKVRGGNSFPPETTQTKTKEQHDLTYNGTNRPPRIPAKVSHRKGMGDRG
ncbi:MAG: hypothetical protein LBR07_03600 [Puniceicoccales bacterium]|jgi:hypothetical protein|nr:hypothetical protein [Puniceicoccales bacterium]